MPQLYPFQLDAVEKLKTGNHLLAFEPGLGKTPTSITAATQLLGTSPTSYVLIVCPAMTRVNWREEWIRWGAFESHHIGLLHMGKRKNMSTKKLEEWHDNIGRRVTVTSYKLLDKFLDVFPNRFNIVILDEIHHIKNHESGIFKTVNKLLDNHTPDYVWGLSGTLIPNEVKDLYGPLKTLFPRLFPRYWDFAGKYCRLEKNEYGTAVVGANMENLPQLKKLLVPLSTRRTRAEVAEFLPRLQLIPIYLDQGLDRLQALQEWLDDAPRPSIVLTHTRAQAHQLAELYGRPLKFVVTGEQDVQTRLRLIDNAAKMRAIVFATMHSVEEGINNLANYGSAIFFDLYWRPKTMVQVIGRFSRLNSATDRNAQVHMFVRKNTVDERIAATLTERIDAMNHLFKAGQGEQAFADSLEYFGRTEEQFKEDLLKSFGGDIDLANEY